VKRFRLGIIVVGVVGALAVAAAVLIVLQLGRGSAIELPVAVDDIPPGTTISAGLFQLAEVRGMDEELLASRVTREEFADYEGLTVVESVPAGFPLSKAQVADEGSGGLTALLDDPAHLVFPLPVTADQAGNFIREGDYVDVVFSLGRVSSQALTHVEEIEDVQPPQEPMTDTLEATPVPHGPPPGESVTTTLRLPLSKVILGDVHVIRVEREQVPASSSGLGLGDDDGRTRQTLEGDVVRLYLELDREQVEVLSFALHNGALTLPAHAEPIGGSTEGFTWDDFSDLFYQGRPEAELRGEE